MRNNHCLTSSVLSILAAGCVLVGVSSTGFAQASSGPMCSQVAPDQCEVETFAGATSGLKGTSWILNGWDFEVFNYNGSTQIEVDTSYTDFGTAVRLGCHTTRIEFPDDLSVRYVTFPIDGDFAGQGWMEVLAVDASGQILDQTFRYNEQAHGAETVYLGPVRREEPAIDKVVIHTVEDPDVDCDFVCSEFYIGEIRACASPNVK
jgi:hypothetical protein